MALSKATLIDLNSNEETKTFNGRGSEQMESLLNRLKMPFKLIWG